MPVILGVLGSIVTILFLLRHLAELGIDLAGLNPFLWHRRRQWMKRSQGNPIYRMDNPMDVTALMMVAAAKSDGDMTSEEKHKILEMFQDEFKLSRRDASDLMVASVYLLHDGSELRANVDKVLTRCIGNFTREQAESAAAMIARVAEIDSRPNEIKQEFVQAVLSGLKPATVEASKWH